MLVLAGFTNGFFPTRDFFDATVTTPDKQKLVRATDTRRLYAAAGKATQRLAASWFTSIGLVEAETLKLEIGRVKLRRGERIAVTTPSIYLADIDPAAEPSTPGLPDDSQAPGDAAGRTLILNHSEEATRPSRPPPHANPSASGRPPSPHTPAPAFIRPPGPAPTKKALPEPAHTRSSHQGRHSSKKPPPGEVRAARDLGSANLPLRGLFSVPCIPLRAYSPFDRRISSYRMDDARFQGTKLCYSLSINAAILRGWLEVEPVHPRWRGSRLVAFSEA